MFGFLLWRARGLSLTILGLTGILGTLAWTPPLAAQTFSDLLPEWEIPEPSHPPFIAPELSTVTIKAVGDTILGTNYPSNHLPPQPDALFQRVQSLLTDADFVFANFESTLTNYPHTPKRPSAGRVYAFRSPPEHSAVLKRAGFTILSVANNHSHDFSVQGYQDTIRHIQNQGMLAVGEKNKIVYTEANGLTVAWIGFSYLGHHNSIHDLAQARKLAQQASQNADLVIISVHAGAEGMNAIHTRNQTEMFLGENRGNMVQFSRTMIDHGADLILGHGPHVPRAIELYRGRLIAYSLGNFVGYRTLNTQGANGYSLILAVELEADGQFLEGQIIPLRLTPEGIPYPDPEGRTIQLIRRLNASDFPQTPLEITPEGALIVLPKD
ncbi:CapA family protein [Spirulina subsalsa]|uniref:CapA family protein n=1 Tax=Spirulina subsalsa TaxID=54311 RepID=UPI002238453E|nr:CapA family protein [Spirulina subsalsa]